MGQSACACFEQTMGDLLDGNDEDEAVQQRLRELIAGAKFTRVAYLGLTTQELFVNLTEDLSTIKWKTEKTWTKTETGEIDLTAQVKKVKSSGETGLQFIGLDESVVFDIKSVEAAVRDKWVVALNELLQSWVEKPDTKPKSGSTPGGFTDKAEYFRRREEEIKAREKANAERKAKYAAGGMKHTAQAMADR